MEDIQSLLERINRDGVEKAEAEAARIVAAAKEKAAAIVAQAQEEAEKTRASAAKSAEEYAARGAESVRQAARDAVISARDAVSAVLERLLAKDVEAALADPETVKALAAEAVRELAGPGEIACAPKLAEALKAQLAAGGGFEAVVDESAGSGFTVRIDGGRVEHSYTAEVVSAELARRLRPDLAALLA